MFFHKIEFLTFLQWIHLLYLFNINFILIFSNLLIILSPIKVITQYFIVLSTLILVVLMYFVSNNPITTKQYPSNL